MHDETLFSYIEIPPKPNLKPSIQIEITGIADPDLQKSILQEFIKSAKKKENHL